MSTVLQHAIDRLRKLPEERQDQLAQLLLHEIDEDEKWARSTHANSAKLERLVDQVIAADDRGECEPLDPDQL